MQTSYKLNLSIAAVELLHEPPMPSSSAAAGSEAAERAALAMRQVEAICGGDPECEEDFVVEEEDDESEMQLEPRPRRGGSGYYFRTRKDGMEVSALLTKYLQQVA